MKWGTVDRARGALSAEEYSAFKLSQQAGKERAQRARVAQQHAEMIADLNRLDEMESYCAWLSLGSVLPDETPLRRSCYKLLAEEEEFQIRRLQRRIIDKYL